jgi:hypothetical protein
MNAVMVHFSLKLSVDIFARLFINPIKEIALDLDDDHHRLCLLVLIE